MKKLFVLFTLLVLLAGCALAPQGPEGAVVIAKTSLTAAYDTLATLAIEKRITKEEGQAYLQRLGKVKTGLDLAKTYAISGDIATSETQLRLATSALALLREELIKREAEKGVK